MKRVPTLSAYEQRQTLEAFQRRAHQLWSYANDLLRRRMDFEVDLGDVAEMSERLRRCEESVLELRHDLQVKRAQQLELEGLTASSAAQSTFLDA